MSCAPYYAVEQYEPHRAVMRCGREECRHGVPSQRWKQTPVVEHAVGIRDLTCRPGRGSLPHVI
jgi:hypothetical protein